MDSNDDEENVIYQTDEEELAKENNPYYKEFLKVKTSCRNIGCLISIILTALDNDFEELDKNELINYIELIKEHLQKHHELLNNFYSKLNLPNGKTRLIPLRTYIKPEK